MDERKRQRGVIKRVTHGKDDHGLLVFNADIDFGNSGQGFQCALDPDLGPRWMIELCNIFAVSSSPRFTYSVGEEWDLEGEECYALRSFSYNNAYIVGLESVKTGRRFTRSGFMKKHRPDGAKSELAYELESRCREIQFFIRRIREERERMKEVREDYVDWEVQP